MVVTQSYTGTQNQTIVAGVAGKIIRVRRLILSSTGTNTYYFRLMSEDVTISPDLRPGQHLDVDFSNSHERFQTAAGESLKGVSFGSGVQATLWLDYDVVDA